MVTDREIINSRVVDAPREKVWRAWTEPEHLAAWWGPSGFRNTFHEFDFRPGGRWHFTMHGPDGKNYLNTSNFKEIVKPERLVFMHESVPRYHGTAIIEDMQGKSRVTYTQVFEKPLQPKFREFLLQAGGQLFDRLGAELKNI